MKKIIITTLTLFLIVLTQQKAFAQEIIISQIPTPTPVVQVQYDLPYPGLLPDNPLYFLKALRDNILALLITDPLKKSNYDLLMADKRLVSAQSLFVENKNDLAITTLSKSGNYFDRAIQDVASAKRQGEDADSTIDKLITASKKHELVISDLEQKSKGNIRASLDGLLKRAKIFEQTVEELKAK